MPNYVFLESIVPDLHDMRIDCLIRAVPPFSVTNTVSLTLVIDYAPSCSSFEALHATVKCRSSVGSGPPVPTALNKHYSAVLGLLMYRLCMLLRVGILTS